MEPYIGNQFQSHPSNSGLLRFRSAPSSLISAYTAGTVSNGGGLDKGFDFNQLPTPVDHSGKPLPRFLESTNNDGGAEDPSSPGFDAVETKPFLLPHDGYSGYGSNQLPPYPKPNPGMNAPFQLECSGPVAVDQSTTLQRKRIGCSSSTSSGGGSNLTRRSSSPAGFFAHQNSPSGYNIMGGGGVSSSVLGHLPRIPESTKETTATSSPDVRDSDRYRNGEDAVAAAEFYGTNGFSFGSWDDHSPSPENLSSEFKAHNQQNDSVLYSGSEASPSQSGGVSSRQMLSHHLSLPRSSTDITGVDKLLNFQNSVPCKIRAKRGCATHPRSIAERVRRTRISDRMKKLQELVPNMDKQINTSDMLDLAVDYIKVLQTQYKMLADRRARCVCLNARQHHHAASDQSL